MLHSKSYYLQAAKALGVKRPRRFARKMVNKQFEKAIPHGGVRRFENALRRGDRTILGGSL